MKSIQILRRFSFREWGGTESVVWNCTKKLIEKGNPSEIFATSALDQTGDEELEKVKIRRFNYFYPHLNIKKPNLIVLDKKGGNPYSRQMYKALTSPDSVDILHCHTMNRLANLVRLSSKKLSIPYVISFHGGYFNVPQSEIDEMMKPLKGTFNYGKFIDLYLKTDRFLKDADGILCVGYKESLSAKERFPEKIVEYLPNGVNFDKFKAVSSVNNFREKHSISSDKRMILCVSRIDYQKNQEILLDLLFELKKKNEKAHLVIIGPVTSSAYLEKIQSKIDKYQLHSDVTVIKGLHADSPELINAYNSADCFILPSVHEPFGIVVLEAWASRIPVIASDVGGLSNLLTDKRTGLFFNNVSVEDLVEKYFYYRNNPQAEKNIVNEAYDIVRSQYSWDTIADRLVEFYMKVIDKYKNKKR